LHEITHDIMRDMNILLSHTTFLFDKINFLMDAAMGFINIEQNKIIKTFSIAAVVFMPPTLIASIYGMNFKHIPELKWLWGYPGSLAIMVLSGIAPYWLFKRKGWL
jgi:magnesium transporter